MTAAASALAESDGTGGATVSPAILARRAELVPRVAALAGRTLRAAAESHDAAMGRAAVRALAAADGGVAEALRPAADAVLSHLAPKLTRTDLAGVSAADAAGEVLTAAANWARGVVPWARSAGLGPTPVAAALAIALRAPAVADGLAAAAGAAASVSGPDAVAGLSRVARAADEFVAIVAEALLEPDDDKAATTAVTDCLLAGTLFALRAAKRYGIAEAAAGGADGDTETGVSNSIVIVKALPTSLPAAALRAAARCREATGLTEAGVLVAATDAAFTRRLDAAATGLSLLDPGVNDISAVEVARLAAAARAAPDAVRAAAAAVAEAVSAGAIAVGAAAAGPLKSAGLWGLAARVNPRFAERVAGFATWNGKEASSLLPLSAAAAERVATAGVETAARMLAAPAIAAVESGARAAWRKVEGGAPDVLGGLDTHPAEWASEMGDALLSLPASLAVGGAADGDTDAETASLVARAAALAADAAVTAAQAMMSEFDSHTAHPGGRDGKGGRRQARADLTYLASVVEALAPMDGATVVRLRDAVAVCE